jgi:glycerophosphoryl diester phosphodiesterase
MQMNFVKYSMIFWAGVLLGTPAFAVSDQDAKLANLLATKEVKESNRYLGLCAAARKMDLQGHRGMQGYPNNTIDSFRAGYRAGADTVELDLQITSDDRILVAHDPTLDPKRCALIGGKPLVKKTIRQMSFAEAQNVVCAEAVYSPNVAAAPMPELAQVFSEFKNTKTVSGNPAKLNIEIKYDANNPQYFPEPKEYVRKIIQVIRQGGWPSNRMIVQSFDYNILKLFKEQSQQLAKEQHLGLSIEVVPLIGDGAESVRVAKELSSRLVTPSFTQLTPAIVSQLHAMKVKVIPWTPNSEEEMLKVISMGPDGIITDHPDLFLKIRNRLCNP